MYPIVLGKVLNQLHVRLELCPQVSPKKGFETTTSRVLR